VLETERMILRGHELADFDDCVALWGDPIVTRFIGGKPSTREETWSRLLRNRGHWSLLGFGYWVVRERATGRFIGEVGFANLEREIEPSLRDAPEAGWVLAPWSHGKGFATEALRAALAWLDSERGARRTVCIIDPDNAASRRVAQKCGYRELARTVYKGSATIVHER
jgi:RimJ/RimL family protein N-acetyltransferase